MLRMNILTFIFIVLFSTPLIAQNGKVVESDSTNIVSAYTKDKDTLYLPNNKMGTLLREAWDKDKARVEKRPEILMVPEKELRSIVQRKRGELVVLDSSSGI